MAFGVDSKGRPIYYDVDRTYTQADFNELLRQLAANESISRIDSAAIADDLAFRARYEAAQRAMGDNPMDWSIQQEAAQRYGSYGLPGTDFRQVTDPQTGETYYTRRLMSGGPGDRDNTFKLGEGFDARDDQDWYLEAIYNADGTLREIAPRERVNTSSWVNFRDAIKPVAIMAGLVAGGGWLANALQGAGAGAAGAGAGAGGAGAGAGAAAAGGLGDLSAAGYLASGAGVSLPTVGPEAAAIMAAGGSGTAAGQAILNQYIAGASAGAGAGAGASAGTGASAGAGAGAGASAGTGASAAQQAAQTSVLGRVAQGIRDYVAPAASVIGALAGVGAGEATVQPPVQPQAPTVPGVEAPPEARGYQAARDPIIDVLQRNRRGGRNRTMITGYGGVPLETVRTGGNTLLGL